MSNENLSLQKLLSKILTKSILDKLHNQLQKNNISHNRLSVSAGKNHSAFNKTFNTYEQLTLSSFLRYLYAASSMTNSTISDGPFQFSNFIHTEELEILKLISLIKDCNLDSLENKDILFLKHLKYHFDILQKNSKLTKDEIDIYNKLYNSIN